MRQSLSSARNTPSDPEFEASWRRLMASGRSIVALAEARHWQRARRLHHARLRLSREHFARYPLGPRYKACYWNRLSDLFSIEQHIDGLLSDHNSSASQYKPALRRVK